MNEFVQENLFENEKISNYVLLSLQEQPYLDIKSGIKIYEYRTRYQKVPTTAFVYVSQKVKKIMGIMEFGSPIIGSAEEISSISEKIKPGSYDVMMEYMKKGVGYAIPVKQLTEIEPVSLKDLRCKIKGFTVPQSYYMLNNKKELLEYLLSLKHLNIINFERETNYEKSIVKEKSS